MSTRSRAKPWFRTVDDYGRRCAEHTTHLQRHDVWRWPDEKLLAIAEQRAGVAADDVAALAAEVLRLRAGGRP